MASLVNNPQNPDHLRIAGSGVDSSNSRTRLSLRCHGQHVGVGLNASLECRFLADTPSFKNIFMELGSSKCTRCSVDIAGFGNRHQFTWLSASWNPGRHGTIPVKMPPLQFKSPARHEFVVVKMRMNTEHLHRFTIYDLRFMSQGTFHMMRCLHLAPARR